MRPTLSKTDLGEAARQAICAKLMLSGAKVFRPMTEDTPTDLLVLRGLTPLKCQCKCFYLDPSGCHVMNLFSVRKSGPGSKAVKHKYTAEEVDFFLGYCVEDDSVYVIPYEACGGRSSLRFWISASPKNTGNPGFDPKPWKAAYHLLSS